MKIGIDASRAFASQRTGIEEYSYQAIKHLMDKLDGHQVILYIRAKKGIESSIRESIPNFPQNWQVKIIKLPYLWTQVGLSLEMLFHPVDTLFIPAHVVSIVHPKNTIVTVHGLEFEIFPECYSFWARLYMRWSIKMSCRWAKKIIAVSENTKKDLIKLYKVPEDKIGVIYDGVSGKLQIQNYKSQINPKLQIQNYKPYLLFVGRLEKRKNVEGIIEAFKILKEKYNIRHKLILAGKPGYGFENLRFNENIILPGFVSEEEKYNLLKNADIFLFPTLYEGFGIPVLEAQSMGAPVITSNISSLPEVGADSVVYCYPKSPESIAGAIYKLISNEELKNDIIKKGYENVKKFSWENCSFEVSKLLINQDGNK